MANTTDNEFQDTPKEPKAEKAPKEPKTNEEKIVALYIEGKNLYDIAFSVFEFGGDEAVARVRQVLGNAGLLDANHAKPPQNIED